MGGRGEPRIIVGCRAFSVFLTTVLVFTSTAWRLAFRTCQTTRPALRSCMFLVWLALKRVSGRHFFCVTCRLDSQLPSSLPSVLVPPTNPSGPLVYSQFLCLARPCFGHPDPTPEARLKRGCDLSCSRTRALLVHKGSKHMEEICQLSKATRPRGCPLAINSVFPLAHRSRVFGMRGKFHKMKPWYVV
ncbi:unnamed protein product [Ectocarpus fasciculatus]